MIARVLKVEAIFKTSQFPKKAHVCLIPRQGSNQRPYGLQAASLPPELSWFSIDNFKVTLFVCQYISYFQSLMDVQPLWHVDVYQQNVFRRGRNKAETHIPNQTRNPFSFVSMRMKKKKSVSRSDFDSRCKPGVSSSWMQFDFWVCYRKFSIV